MGLSLLTHLDLTDLVAHTEEEYIAIAQRLASEPERIAELRDTLRARMLASPLCDAPRAARELENVYRRMWENWCRCRT